MQKVILLYFRLFGSKNTESMVNLSMQQNGRTPRPSNIDKTLIRNTKKSSNTTQKRTQDFTSDLALKGALLFLSCKQNISFGNLARDPVSVHLPYSDPL